MRVSQGESRSRERDRTDLIKSTDLLCRSQTGYRNDLGYKYLEEYSRNHKKGITTSSQFQQQTTWVLI